MRSCEAGHRGPLADADGRPVAAAAIQALTSYLEALRPRPQPALAHDAKDSVLFAEIGCAACHVGAFVISSDPAVTGRPVERITPFTDLLLHDLGPELAEAVAGGDRLQAEWRTALLWGLRYRKALLHDGRAATPDGARGRALARDGAADAQKT